MRRLRQLVVLAAIVLLAGCQEGREQQQSDTNEITVTGEFGSVPVVTFEPPLEMQEASVETLVTGTGRTLAAGDPVLLAITAYSGEDGTILAERGAGAPRNLTLTRDDVGAELFAVLDGASEGSRLLMVQPVDDGGPDIMLVVVVDVLSTRATGEAVPPPEGVPLVTVDDAGVPTVTMPEGIAEPTALSVVPLIRGEGPQVLPGQDVIVQYTAWSWDDGTVYDSTWENGAVPATLAIDEKWAGLRDGVVDQTVGSQVMLLIPPALATGTDSMVIVVDILAASGEGDALED